MVLACWPRWVQPVLRAKIMWKWSHSVPGRGAEKWSKSSPGRSAPMEWPKEGGEREVGEDIRKLYWDAGDRCCTVSLTQREYCAGTEETDLSAKILFPPLNLRPKENHQGWNRCWMKSMLPKTGKPSTTGIIGLPLQNNYNFYETAWEWSIYILIASLKIRCVDCGKTWIEISCWENWQKLLL